MHVVAAISLISCEVFLYSSLYLTTTTTKKKRTAKIYQGGGGVTNPGGVQETFRYCTEGHVLVGYIDDTWIVGLDDLGGLFQPW